MKPLSMPLPALPLEAWEESKITLHYYLQVVGKLQFALNPKQNHWWHITLRIGPEGIYSQSIPAGDRMLNIVFNLLAHRLEIHCSTGANQTFPLSQGLSVAEFYQLLMEKLKLLGVTVRFYDRPFDMPLHKPFSEITEQASYQPEWVQRFWQALAWTDTVFKEFSGRFTGKNSPSQLFWHHMDLAVTRFSGRKAPPMPAGTRQSDKEAYSHEVISFGFWAGDEQVRESMYYSYTFPAPEGLDREPLQPGQASWQESNGSPMALLPYRVVQEAKDPEQVLLQFMESAYRAGAKKANWPVQELEAVY